MKVAGLGQLGGLRTMKVAGLGQVGGLNQRPPKIEEI
jgi:hypothetical protein